VYKGQGKNMKQKERKKWRRREEEEVGCGL
jgi:hypothetical protein